MQKSENVENEMYFDRETTLQCNHEYEVFSSKIQYNKTCFADSLKIKTFIHC